jgi:mRNA interferase MazF
MAITGQTRSHIGIGEFLIEDWQGAGLLKSSAVKSAISTIDQRLVMRILGGRGPRQKKSAYTIFFVTLMRASNLRCGRLTKNLRFCYETLHERDGEVERD